MILCYQIGTFAMEKINGFEIVEKFLDKWKSDATEWYSKKYAQYLEEKAYNKANPSLAQQLYKNQYERKDEIRSLLNERFKYDAEKDMWFVPSSRYRDRWEGIYNALVGILNEEHYQFEEKWKVVIKHLNKKISYEESVEKMLQKEYERKYEKLVSDVQRITENVEKADLYIGDVGNIEGFIEGLKGKAEIWSTYVVGEIQCPHFRFYCHKR